MLKNLIHKLRKPKVEEQVDPKQRKRPRDKMRRLHEDK